jgi:hypothetical protein
MNSGGQGAASAAVARQIHQIHCFVGEKEVGWDGETGGWSVSPGTEPVLGWERPEVDGETSFQVGTFE